MVSEKYNYEKSRELVSKKRANQSQYFERPKNEERKPAWIRADIPSGNHYHEIKKDLRKKGLWTVCEEASCPNIGECWEAKTATLMILGGTCTRACRFCNVDTGNPKGIINLEEIEKSSDMVKTMGLNYVVITSVDRDDLPDHGASHFSNVVKRIREDHPQTVIEVLVPDFDALDENMKILANSGAHVVAQNIETVKRLTHVVRDKRAGYEKTLQCLNFYKKNFPHLTTKTSLMLGHGETYEEILQTMDDLRAINVDIITFGQYLRPTPSHLKVQKYYKPKEFDDFKQIALQKGFEFVASGPLVRSSYKASDFLKHLKSKGLDIIEVNNAK